MGKRLRNFGKKFFVFLNVLALLGLLLSYLSTHISPEDYTFPALFGLSYIFWLGANVFFVIFWLFSKPKIALLSLITILIGYTQFTGYFQLFPHFTNEKPTDSKSIKIISYNVRLFGWYDWKNNKQYRDSLIDALIPEDADIYCFQEYFHSSEPGRFDTENLIKQRLKTPYVHYEYTNWVGKYEKYGIATFSKFPIMNGGRVPLKYDDGNSCIFTDLLVNNDTIRVYNGHVASIRFRPEDYRFMDEIKETDKELKPVVKDGLDVIDRLNIAYKKRAVQVNEMVKSIKSSRYPVIVCSDLNDTPVSYSYTRLSDILIDSFRESGRGFGSTYIGKFPSFRIDYIFHDDSFRAIDYHTLPANISDHHGICATLYWK